MLLRPITFTDLMRMVESFPYEFPSIQPTAEAIQFSMAATVLRTYLGDKWCDINLIGKGDPYLTQSVQDETGSMKSQDRIIALAEMVLTCNINRG